MTALQRSHVRGLARYVVLLAGFLLWVPNGSAQKPTRGEPAPDIDLPTLGGGHVKLSSLKGHPVSFYREQLSALRVTPADNLDQMPDGRHVRVAGIVLALLSLILVPYGTVVGAYGLWVLLSKGTEPLFAQPQRA